MVFFNFDGLFVGIKYLFVICIGWQTVVSGDMDEIVHEYVEY